MANPLIDPLPGDSDHEDSWRCRWCRYLNRSRAIKDCAFCGKPRG